MKARLRKFEQTFTNGVLRIRDLSTKRSPRTTRPHFGLLNESFETLLSQAPIIFFAFDKNRKYVLSEGRGLSALGRKPGESVGKSIYDLYPKDSWFAESVNKTFETGEPVSTSGSRRGTPLWFDAELVPVTDENGNVIQVIGMGIDVTARKQYETICGQQLAALTASIDGLAVYGPDERIIYANDAHARFYGYENPDEIIGKSWKIFYDGKELQRFVTEIMPVFSKNGQWRGEATGTRKDGSHFFQEISLGKVGTDDGLVCVVRDITEQKRAEERQSLIAEVSKVLLHSKDYTGTIAATSTLGIPSFSDYTIICVNPIQRFGEERHLGTCSPLEQSIIDGLKSHTFHRNPEVSELVNYPGNGVEPELLKLLGVNSYIFVPLRTQNSVIGNIAFLRTKDHLHGQFTELDHLAAQEIGTRAALAIENSRLFMEAQEAVQIRENVMATVSHDLRNPLTAISIGFEFLARVIQRSPVEARNANIICNIKTSIERMNVLIKQLLEFEKLRSGKLLLDKRLVSLREMIDKATSEIKPLCQEKELQFETHLDSGLEAAKLNCDSQKLLQVFSNLMGNAVKFTPKNGQVDLHVYEIENEIHFKITDTGVGIPTEDLKHVFELYWQANRTSSQGHGLGLAIAQGIVCAHEGRIWVDSKIGVGSVFTFAIPKT